MKKPRQQPLTLGDAVRYHMSTPQNPMEIGALLRLSGRMSQAALEAFVSQRLLRHERFRQTVDAPRWLGARPHWSMERNFRLSAHVFAHASEDAASEALSERALARALSASFSERLSFERSPWRFELFSLEDGSTALLLRVHHCIADGRALVQLLSELADGAASRAFQLPRARASRPKPASPASRSLVHQARELGLAAWHLLSLRDHRPSELHTALSGTTRVAWSAPLELRGLVRAAAAGGYHASDLLLAAAAGALCDALREVGSSVPRHVQVLVPLAPPPRAGELGNHYASVFVRVPLDEPDPHVRLARTAEATRKLHDQSETRLATGLIGLAGLLAPPLTRAVVDRFSRKASFVLSNVPGPTARVALMGHEVRSITVFAPASASLGVSFTVFGYGSELRLGVETDAALQLPPERLVRAFERILSELQLEAATAARPEAAARAIFPPPESMLN